MNSGLGSFSALYVNTILSIAEKFGADRADLLRKSDINPHHLCAPNSRISTYKVIDLFWLAIEQTGHPELGLHVGASFKPGSLGMLGILLMSSRTMRDAIQMRIRYQTLIHDLGASELIEKAGVATLRWSPKVSNTERMRPFSETVLAANACFGRWLTWQTDFPITRIEFQHQRPDNADGYLQLFQCPVEFSRPQNALITDAGILDLPLQQYNEEILKSLQIPIQKELSSLNANSGASTAQRLRGYLVSRLGDRAPSLEQAAVNLNCSTRTLRRKLNIEQTSYSQVWDEVRKDAASYYLAETRVSICELAQMLGYSNQSAFNNAFKSWFQLRPTEFRETRSVVPDSEQRHWEPLSLAV